MLRITRQTDYGILILTHMATLPAEDIATARDLAERCNLSVPMVSKTLKPLARAGIVESLRGVKGGYRLARPATEVTIGEIVAVLEGPIGMTECVSSPGSCEQETVCPTKVNWERISHAVRGALDDIPLAEMVDPARSALLSIGG